MLLSGQAWAHVEYYDLNKGVRIVDRTDLVAGDHLSALPMLAAGNDRIVEGEGGGVWTITPASGSSPQITSVTVNDAKRFGWIAGTHPEQGDSHVVNFFNFHLDQAAYVNIGFAEKDAGLDPAFSLYKGLLVYYGHDDAASDPLNPLDDDFNRIQSTPDSGTVVDGQGILSPFRDTVNADVEYIGQFNALNGWSQGRQDGDWWSAVQYLTHRNDGHGATETLEGFPLAPGDYTIAASGAACSDFAENRACRDPVLSATLTYSAVPVCGQAQSRPLLLNEVTGSVNAVAGKSLQIPVSAVDCGGGAIVIKARGLPKGARFTAGDMDQTSHTRTYTLEWMPTNKQAGKQAKKQAGKTFHLKFRAVAKGAGGRVTSKPWKLKIRVQPSP